MAASDDGFTSWCGRSIGHMCMSQLSYRMPGRILKQCTFVDHYLAVFFGTLQFRGRLSISGSIDSQVEEPVSPVMVMIEVVEPPPPPPPPPLAYTTGWAGVVALTGPARWNCPDCYRQISYTSKRYLPVRWYPGKSWFHPPRRQL